MEADDEAAVSVSSVKELALPVANWDTGPLQSPLDGSALPVDLFPGLFPAQSCRHDLPSEVKFPPKWLDGFGSGARVKRPTA